MGRPERRPAWADRALGVAGRVLSRPTVARMRAVLDRFSLAEGGLLAAGIAFNAMFALLPLAILASGVIGFLLGDPESRIPVLAFLVDWAPPLAGVLDEVISGLADASPSLSIVGIVGAAWGTTRLFASLESGIGAMFTGVPRRGLVARAALRLASILVTGLVVAAALVIGPALSFAAESIGQVGPLAAIGLGLALLVLPYILAVLALIAVYRVMPPSQATWSSIVRPAAIVGLTVVVLTRIFAIAAPRLLGANFVYGTLGAIFVALAWLQLVFSVILLGAAWVGEREVAAAAARARADSAEPAGPESAQP